MGRSLPPRGKGPAFGASTVAGFVTLFTSIGMFLLTGLGEVLFERHIDLFWPAVAYLAIACYVLCGVTLHRLLQGLGIRGQADDGLDD